MEWDVVRSLPWQLMIPEFILLGATILLSIIDLLTSKRKYKFLFPAITIIAILGAIFTLFQLLYEPGGTILYDTFRLDIIAKLFKLVMLIGAVVICLFTLEEKDGKHRVQVTGEYYYLLLVALLGAMMLASSGDIITLFVSLELLAIPAYILVAIRKHQQSACEAGWKFFINGGIASAFILFAFSYLYGMTGSTNLEEIAASLTGVLSGETHFIVALSFFMLLVGIGFKISSVPFHLWTPDVYEGASFPITAFLNTISKMAGFVLLARICWTIFVHIPIGGMMSEGFLSYIQPFVVTIACVSMIIGHIMALRQLHLKRMLAYSSIAHGGYVLASFAALSPFTFEAMWFYLTVYTFMTIGVFAILQLLETKEGSVELQTVAGLYERAPVLTVLLSFFILSLAAIPGTAGFIAKVELFLALFTAEGNLSVVAIVMGLSTVLSLVYYFGVLVQLYFRKSEQTGALAISWGSRIAIFICFLAMIWGQSAIAF
jgi:NADH-quinone oxidoreductase subunit N